MIRPTPTRPRNAAKVVLIAAAALALGACQTVKEDFSEDFSRLSDKISAIPERMSQGLPALGGEKKPDYPMGKWANAPMPTYKRGETFTYANGRVERVVAVNGSEVTFERENGRRFTRDRNFVVPRLAWETRSRTGEHRVWGNQDRLWPLEVGNNARLRAERRMTQKDSGEVDTSMRKFECNVDGSEKVSVKAGTFATYRIRCVRYNARASRIVSTETWYYAPRIGHYVRRDTQYASDGRREVKELAKYRVRS